MYKLILMDCNMPIMDGFEATRAIRTMIEAYNETKNITMIDRLNHRSIGENAFLMQPMIVALTAYNTDKFKDKSLSIGMDDFLTKPINTDKLKELLIRVGLVSQKRLTPPLS
jgi:CheY-like chemotaxis protein